MSQDQAGTTDAKTNQELVDLYEWLRRVSREVESAPAQPPVGFLRAAAEKRLGRRVCRRIRLGAPKIGGGEHKALTYGEHVVSCPLLREWTKHVRSP